MLAYRILIAVCLTGGLLLGPPAIARPAVIQRIPAGLIFDGPIDADAVSQITRTLRPKDKLIIQSMYGEPAAALRLGNLVAERQVEVVVNGSCLSVCALYVFLPAKVKSVPRGASVWFGPSPFLLQTVSRHRPGAMTAPDQLALESHLSAYRRLLAENPMAVDLLKCSDAALKPDLDAKGHLQFEGVPGLAASAIPTRYQYAALSVSVLKTFGAEPVGDYWWPVGDVLRAEIGGGYGLKIAWVDNLEQCSPLEST